MVMTVWYSKCSTYGAQKSEFQDSGRALTRRKKKKIKD